jgi:hypothetical protein
MAPDQVPDHILRPDYAGGEGPKYIKRTRKQQRAIDDARATFAPSARLIPGAPGEKPTVMPLVFDRQHLHLALRENKPDTREAEKRRHRIDKKRPRMIAAMSKRETNAKLDIARKAKKHAANLKRLAREKFEAARAAKAAA